MNFFMEDALKTRDIKYLNVETPVFFAPLLKFCDYLPSFMYVNIAIQA